MEKISNLVDDAIKQFIGNQKTTTIDDRTGGKKNIYIAHLFAWDGREQEIGLVFKVAANEYKMHYFSISNHVVYVIEQLENTTTNPYYWNIIWYIPMPNITT